MVGEPTQRGISTCSTCYKSTLYSFFPAGDFCGEDGLSGVRPIVEEGLGPGTLGVGIDFGQRSWAFLLGAFEEWVPSLLMVKGFLGWSFFWNFGKGALY